MTLLKRVNRVPYGRVLLAMGLGVAIIMLLKRTQRGGRTSQYSMKMDSIADVSQPVQPQETTASGCEMKAGTGLASSLLPREVASQEEFGEFAPEDILAGQNFLDTRSQVGIPETTGGALRNANHSIRAEPPNPKQAFTWNNSTINTDTMQRPLI